LTPENLEELVAAATHKSKTEIETLLALRFPKPDVMTRITAIPAPALGGAGERDPDPVPASLSPPAEQDLDPVHASPPRPIEQARSKVTPLSPGRYALELTMSLEFDHVVEVARGGLVLLLPTSIRYDRLRQ
jgi:hypothetical protein